MSEPVAVRQELDPIFRAEYGRTVAALIRRFGDFSLAEDAVGEAIVVACEKWPVEGLPANPGAWLTTTAHRKALDRLRRDTVGDQKHREAAYLGATAGGRGGATDGGDDAGDVTEPVGPIEEDRLRLIFTCCHPALAPEARIALTLRMLGGLTVTEIARAFLVPERTLAQRITRAKKKISDAGIPYRVPGPADLPRRLAGVLHVLYLVFNEGYLAAEGSDVRDDLAHEAVRLTRELRDLAPDEPEVTGLLALELLTLARRPARVVDSHLVPLDRQDRRLWSQSLIAEGHGLVRECLALVRDGGEPPGQFQIQAAINAAHCDAVTFAETAWPQVVALYDQLLAVAPSPVVELNRAVAQGEITGSAAALATIEGLDLSGYPDWHAARGELLARLGRAEEAAAAWERAEELTANDAQAGFLRSRRTGLGGTR